MPNYASGISGVIPIRDNFALDYCAHLGVQSLLPVCDEVIVVDGGSTDNTVEFFSDWALTEPKIRVIHYEIPRLPTPEEVECDDPNRPRGNPVMLIPWINAGRLAARYDWQMHLDGDEVLDPCSYSWMNYYKMDGNPVYIRRLNLWGSPQWEAPHGTVCGENVVRFGPTRMEMHSDEPCPDGEPEIRRNASQADGPLIVHLGFLRKQPEFLKKSRIMQGWLHNTHDSRLKEAEKTGKSWVELSPFPEDRPLIPCTRKFAPYVNEWLVARGYTLN